MTLRNNYNIIQPVATTNYALNPAFAAWTGAVPDDWTVPLGGSVPTTRPGVWGRYAASLDNAGDTLTQVITAANTGMTGSVFTASCWVYVGGIGSPMASITITDALDGTNTATTTDSVPDGTIQRWERISATITAGGGGTSTLIITLTAIFANVLFDGVQVEHGATATTYCDGDQGDGYAWTGQRWHSPSTRSADVRTGGLVRNLGVDLGMSVTGATGMGMPPIQNLSQPNAALPGEQYLGSRVKPGSLNLQVLLKGTSDDGLLSTRKTLGALIEPRDGQPFVLRYDGTGIMRAANSPDFPLSPWRIVDLACVYAGGMEYGKQSGTFDETVNLTLQAYDTPFWVDTLLSTTELKDDDAGGYGSPDLPNVGSLMGRVGGLWTNLQDGGLGNNPDLPGGVYGSATSPDGLVYFCGKFIKADTADGYSRVAGWNGTRLFKLTGGQKLTITGGPPVSGNFKLTVPATGSIGAVTTGNILYNADKNAVGTAIQTALDTAAQGGTVTVSGAGNLPSATFTIHFSGSYRQQDVGTLTPSAGSPNLSAGSVSIVHGYGLGWDTPSMAPLVDGANSVDVGTDGRVWVGGLFRAADWTGTEATSIGANNVAVYDPNATGNGWGPLGTNINNGTNGAVRCVCVAPNGMILVGGDFTNVYDSFIGGNPGAGGGLAVNGIASYNPFTKRWSALGAGVTMGTYGGVYSIVVKNNLTVMIGGAFTAVGAAVPYTAYLAKYEQSTWKTMVSGVALNGGVYALALDIGENLYVGGGFTSPGLHVCKYNSAGTAFYALGGGVNGTVRALAILSDKTVMAVGDMTAADSPGVNVNQVTGWNGWAWTNVDARQPGAPTVRTITARGNDFFIGFGTEGPAKRAAVTTVNNSGQAPVRPQLVFTNGGTDVEHLWWIERQNGESPRRIYLNQSILPGEIITVDCSIPVIHSDRRGNLLQNIIPGSDLALLELLPGDNSIATFVSRIGQNEIQHVVVADAGDHKWTLCATRTIDNIIWSETTSPEFSYGASVATIQAALDNDTYMHYTVQGNTLVSGTANAYDIEFINELARTDVPALFNNYGGVPPVGGASVTVTTTQTGVSDNATVSTTAYLTYRPQHYGIDGAAA